jgi:hypothetical protein
MSFMRLSIFLATQKFPGTHLALIMIVVPAELHTVTDWRNYFMTKKLFAVSCVSLLLLIQPQILLAQSAHVQDKPATTESDAANKALLNEKVIAQDRPANAEGDEANGKNLPAQDAVVQDNWELLKNIPAGDELTVETRDGKRTKGRMNYITDTTLTISSMYRNRAINFAQPEIKKIYRQVPDSRARSAVKGAVIGAIIGAGIGAFVVAIYPQDTSEGELFASAVGQFAALGASFGALFKGSRKILVYEVK